jgi:hypothetical protein
MQQDPLVEVEKLLQLHLGQRPELFLLVSIGLRSNYLMFFDIRAVAMFFSDFKHVLNV